MARSLDSDFRNVEMELRPSFEREQDTRQFCTQNTPWKLLQQ